MPIAEFGIGFVSVFQLGDEVVVETAGSGLVGNDVTRRTLRMDGVGRLIEVSESANNREPRFAGTRVTIVLTSVSDSAYQLTWQEVSEYARSTFVNLPYTIGMSYSIDDRTEQSYQLRPAGLSVNLLSDEEALFLRIPVSAPQLRGELAISMNGELRARKRAHFASAPIVTVDETIGIGERKSSPSWLVPWARGSLLRGGFVVGGVPGLPSSGGAFAVVEVSAGEGRTPLLPSTDLARTRIAQDDWIRDSIFEVWFRFLIDHSNDVDLRRLGPLRGTEQGLSKARWLSSYSALQLYQCARMLWFGVFSDQSKFEGRLEAWEAGEGPAVYVGQLGSLDLHGQILQMVLGNEAVPVLSDESVLLLEPPARGWQDRLALNFGYVSQPPAWSDTFKFDPNIKKIYWDDVRVDDVLMYAWAGHGGFNSRFRIEGKFPRPQRAVLFKALVELLDARHYKRQAVVDRGALEVLKSAIEEYPEAIVAGVAQNVALRDLLSEVGLHRGAKD